MKMLFNPKILAIYREDENMNAAVKLLEDKGYNVFSETSVFQAILTSTEKRVDIIKRHGGALTVRSQLDKGTICFTNRG